MAEPKLPWVKRALQRVSWGAIALLAFVLLYSGWFAVDWVANEHEINATVGNETGTKAVLYYAKQDRVPIRSFGENNADHWGLEQAAFLTAVVAISLYFLRRSPEGRLKSVFEAKKKVRHILNNDKDIDDVIILEPSNLQHQQTDDGPKTPFRREVFSEVEYGPSMGDSAGFHFLCHTLNPYTNDVMDIVELMESPDDRMKCSQCGRSPDFKTITPEGLKQYREKWKEKKI